MKFKNLLSFLLLFTGLVVQKANAQYCTPSWLYGCGSGDGIDAFSTTGGSTNIANSPNGCSPGGTGYFFYSTMTHTGIGGTLFNFTGTTSSYGSSEYVSIWVDWNQNGNFLDPGENVFAIGPMVGAYAPFSGSATIPLTATPGTTRMRVMVNYASAGTPCNTGGSSFGEAEDYNFVVIPPTPCAGMPTPGVATATPAAPCYATSSTLTLVGTSLVANLFYQWESNPGTGWVPIAGATSSSYTVPSVTLATQYRAWVRCITDSAVSNAVTLGAAPVPLNYSETFESITVANQLPSCMTATNMPNSTKTYIVNQSTATNHTTGGSKFGAFYYSPAGTDAFFTPAFNLQAGKTYLFSFWYRGAANSPTYTAFNAYYGTTNTVAAMTNFIGTATPTNTTYQQFAETFTPATTGIYFVGIVATHAVTGTNYYVSIDDIGLDELAPCTGKPAAGTLNTVTPCPNASFTLTRTGGTSPFAVAGLTFQWQDSSSLNNWTASAGINNQQNFTGSVTVNTKFRLLVTCTNSGMADTVISMVNVAPFINCYCIPTYAIGATASIITNVKLNTLNNTSTGVAPWYANYAPQQPGSIAIPNLTMSAVDTVKVTNGTFATNYSAAWVDFNHNSLFEPNEYFGDSLSVGANGVSNIKIMTPSTAMLGLTRMRIRAADRNIVTPLMPCGPTTSGYGEAEDYIVNVQYPICNGPTNAGIARAFDTGMCKGYTTTVYNNTHEYQRSQIQWKWENSIDNGFTWTTVPGSTNKDTLFNILIQGRVSYRLKMLCDATGDSTTSVPVAINIKPPYACYCYSQSNGNQLDTADIGSVVIGTMVNTTQGPHLENPVAIRRRTDYTYIPNILLEAGSRYRFAIFHTQPNHIHEDALVSVFMDFDNDNIYDKNALPNSELVFQGRTNAAFFYIDTFVTIPNAVVPGVPTGMRVILNHDNNPLSPANLGCGPYPSGETEDYVISFKRSPQGVRNVNGLQDVSLYPNPTSGKFTIVANASKQMNGVTVNVSSVTGQTLLNKTYNKVANKFTEELNLGDVAKGVYFVELKTAAGDKTVQKLIVR